MLDKITNIKTDLNLNSKEKRSEYEKFARKPFLREIFGKDSIVFSPAAIFLARLNWHLNEIKNDEKDLYVFDFFVDSIRFLLEIDIKNFFEQRNQAIKIIKHDESSGSKLLTKMEVLKSSGSFSDNKQVLGISEINKFLDSIFNLHIEGELNRSDSFIIDELADDNIDELYYELDQINKAVYKLIEKLGKLNFNEGYSFSQFDELTKIKIDKIVVV